jgi:hypothetical protein
MVLEDMAAAFAMAQAFRKESSCEICGRSSKVYARRLVIARGVDLVMVERLEKAEVSRADIIIGKIIKNFSKDPSSLAPPESELVKRKEGCGGWKGER